MIHVPQGVATLGRRDGFGWDNEFGEHREDVPAFAISKYKVTNEQYKAFVEQGGPVPPFWVKRGERWFLLTMFREMPLPPHWPVYVSLGHAQAYAQWAGLLASDRSPISSRGVRDAERRRARLSLG